MLSFFENWAKLKVTRIFRSKKRWTLSFFRPLIIILTFKDFSKVSLNYTTLNEYSESTCWLFKFRSHELHCLPSNIYRSEVNHFKIIFIRYFILILRPINRDTNGRDSAFRLMTFLSRCLNQDRLDSQRVICGYQRYYSGHFYKSWMRCWYYI